MERCALCGTELTDAERAAGECSHCAAPVGPLDTLDRQRAADLNERIQAEIVRRGLKRQHDPGRDGALDVEAAIEVLEEAEGYSDSEARTLAAEVRAEMVEEAGRRARNRRTLPRRLAITAFVLGGAWFWYQYRSGRYDEVTCKTLFTSAVKDSAPTDELERASFDMGSLTLFIRWQGLPPSEHDYRLLVTDGKGQTAWDSDWKFSSGRGSKSTWSTHRFRPGVEAPGNWRFQVFLDGKPITAPEIEISG